MCATILGAILRHRMLEFYYIVFLERYKRAETTTTTAAYRKTTLTLFDFI